MKRNVGGRKGGIFSRLGNWIAGTKPPATQKGYIEHGHNVADWTSAYNDTPLDGDRYVNGKCCKTVGEYKAAIKKSDSTMGGWSG